MSPEQDVQTAWQAIAGWLAQHAQHSLDVMRPPANQAHLLAAGRALGRTPPDDLLAWWRQTNGAAGEVRLFPPICSPLSVEDAMHRRMLYLEQWNGVQKERDPDRFAAYLADAEAMPAGSPARAWLPSWLPIGGAGNMALFVDCREGPWRGCVQEFFRGQGPANDILWDDFAQLLTDVGDAMLQGSAVRGFKVALTEDHELAWS